MDDPVTQVSNLSRTVAEQHDALTSAIGEDRQAAADLLAQIVDAARPALKALSSRILATERVWWPTSVETASEKDFHPERGVRLAGDGPGRDHPRATEGSVVGRDLVLLEDGSFARVDWSGFWTNWQGRSSRDESTLTAITTLDVVTVWPVDKIAARLVELLQEQAGGRSEKTTATAKARAEKLQAVSALLGSRK